ncbi:hypothetical protein [Kangiella sp. TOML190]|uniref:hypothetical protein n=1 Tax=Kangiella sp. TOML190 TaxID=2931351 RepID=UPI00203C2297|nr:hypothetical protein [Kangiella sp. TOML190]
MATWHIDELKDALQTQEYEFLCVLDGDDYRITGSWSLTKNDVELILDFEGWDEGGLYELNRSFGCKLRGVDEKGLYLPKHKPKPSKPNALKQWESELREFLEILETYVNSKLH